MANIKLNATLRDQIVVSLTHACSRRFNAHRRDAPITPDQFQSLLASDEQLAKLRSLSADGFPIDRWSRFELLPAWSPFRGYKLHFTTPEFYAPRNDYYSGVSVLHPDVLPPAFAEWMRLRWLEARRREFAAITISRVVQLSAHTTQLATMLPNCGRLILNNPELADALNNPSRVRRLCVPSSWANSHTVVRDPDGQSFQVYHEVLLFRLRMLLAEATLFPATAEPRSPGVMLDTVEWLGDGNKKDHSWMTLGTDLWEAGT